MSTSEVWYFAYGSNLNIGQMMTRVGEWIISNKAILKNYKLVFNVNSPRWGGMTANLVKTDNPNDIVYGVLYSISPEKLDVLSVYEKNKPADILVETDGGKLQAKAYIFQTARASGHPSDAYLNVIVDGLIQHGYSEDIIQQVKKIARTF
jgi:hypothetical protein